MARMHYRLPNAPFLLAADIDGTLLGHEPGDAPAEALLRDLVARNRGQFFLAVISGRSKASIQPLIDQGLLPEPDFICGDVGTELFDCRDPHNALGLQFSRRVDADWNLDEIYRRGVGPGVSVQIFPHGQPRFQAGFYWDGDPVTLEAFRQRLADLPGCLILPSFGEYIDVLPAALGKGQAAQFLQKSLGLEAGQVLVAGDTGNDRTLFETGFKGVLPVNALPELKNIAGQPWHYQSRRRAAQGVLDGLEHFGFIARQRIS